VVVAVMDGSDWLQKFIDVQRPDAVLILDFPYAMEHLAPPEAGHTWPDLPKPLSG
jgi:hypothetical protein